MGAVLHSIAVKPSATGLSLPRQLRAIYFDSEEHTIEYSIQPVDDGVVFVSKSPQDAPRFRLTYARAGSERLKLKFEIAPPGKDFATYIEAVARRL